MADRSVSVRLKADISDFNRGMLAAAAGTKAFTKSLDTSNDRMSNLTQSALAVGPALVPIGAAAIPAIAGLSNQLAFAAAGATVAAVAFAGVGDALGAVNDFSLDPTTASLEKMQQAMDKIGPAGQDFVMFLQGLRPQMQEIQNIAQAGLFPGVERGITELMQMAPQFERLVSTIATTMGDLIAEAGDNLNDPRWQEFFTFLEAEARPTLLAMGRTLGNFAEGFANLWMAFQPLSSQFSTSFLQMSRDFAAWTDGLSQTQGFQDFLAYVSRVGPKVWDTLAALGNALLQLVEAAAPVGEVALPAIEALSNVIARLADSDVAPVVIGLVSLTAALSRLKALAIATNGSALLGFADKLGGKGAAFRAAGAGVGIFALSLTDLDEKMGLTNTATFALAGAIAGPWGAAVGAGVGLAMDFAAANDGVWQAIERANTVMSSSGASVSELNAAYDAAAQTVAAFKKSVDDVSLTDFASLKNSFEDAFGRSDVEEAESALDSLAIQREAAIAKAQDQMFAEAGLTGAMQNASQATRDQTAALIENATQAQANANAKSSAIGGEIAYEAAVDATTAAIKKYGQNTNLSTEGGRALGTALRGQIDTWNALTPAAQAARGGLDKARDGMYEAARAAGYGKQESRAMANEMVDLSKINVNIPIDVETATGSAKTAAIRRALNDVGAMKPNPKVTANTDQARNKLSGVIGLLRRIVDKNIRIHTTYTRSQIGGHPTRRADGGLIHGPGGPRDDLVPIMASNKEFIVNAAATAKYLPELYRMNAQRFAAGGPVAMRLDPSPSFASSTGSDGGQQPVVFPVRELERAMERVFDNRKFRLDKDGRTLQLTKARG